MPTLDPTQWLLAGLALMLLVLLCLVIARRWHRARIAANQYRTANGLRIDRESRRILRQPMATRRVRSISSLIPPGHLTSFERADRVETRINFDQLRTRAQAAAIYDMGHGGKRRAGPYTIGSAEHAEWLKAYDAVFIDKPATVQTTAQPADEALAA